jgi:high-affinity nickel-transport protein
MVGAYGWAFVDPMRKLYYNLMITGVSVAVASGIGAIKVLELTTGKGGLGGGAWGIADGRNSGVLGYLVIGVFVASWLGSLAIYRVMSRDKIASARSAAVAAHGSEEAGRSARRGR